MSEPPVPEPPVSPPPVAGAAEAGPSCLLCATGAGSPAAAALTWARERDERGRHRWLCPACARRHLRDIEAKLAPEWW